MTYDIVTRLMEGNHLACGDPGSPWSVRCIKCLAVDEIERLRKAGDALAQGIRTGRWDDALDAWTELRGA
jgi:hypothetical protein